MHLSGASFFLKDMSNFKLIIEYRGTAYNGWQRQENAKSIQEEIEKKLRKLFGRRVNLIGSGRTDTGVHALGQVANFSIDTKTAKDTIKKALNYHLPKDIRIKDVSLAPFDFHSRFSAKGKVYQYIVTNEFSPFLEDRAYFSPGKLDLEKMRKAAKFLIGEADFSSFQNRGSFRKNAIVKLKRIDIKKRHLYPGGVKVFIFEVEGNAFLYRMVRNIVGYLLEVGKGALKPEETKAVLKARDRKKCPPPVPSRGLYLSKVIY